MAVTVDQFLNDDRYAGFSDFSYEAIATTLAEAADDLPDSVWPATMKDRAIKLLACHRLTKQRNAGELGVAIAGNLTSISVSQGSESASFAGSTGDRLADPEGLMDTPCGQELLALRRRVMGNLTGFVA
jgi:hypothetical protein